jgi:hypothetical protein
MLEAESAGMMSQAGLGALAADRRASLLELLFLPTASRWSGLALLAAPTMDWWPLMAASANTLAVA